MGDAWRMLRYYIAMSQTPTMILTPAHIRAARGLLGWSQGDLAEASGVPRRTITRVETGDAVPRDATAESLLHALALAGVEMVYPGPGVILRR